MEGSAGVLGRVDGAVAARVRVFHVGESLSISVSCTDVAWSPNGHFCVGMSCYSETSKQDVLIHVGDDE